MFNNHELWKYGFIDCESCIHCQDRVFCKRKSRTCNFCPEDWNIYINLIINNLRLTITPITKHTKLFRTTRYRPTSSVSEELFTADMFYVELINDSLHLIRTGHYAYVFSLDHIVDILRFEPDVNVYYDKDVNSFKLWKTGGRIAVAELFDRKLIGGIVNE